VHPELRRALAERRGNDKHPIVRTEDGGVIVTARTKPVAEAERVANEAVPVELELPEGFVAWKLGRFSRPMPWNRSADG
jgi:hypothetical protein